MTSPRSAPPLSARNPGDPRPSGHRTRTAHRRSGLALFSLLLLATPVRAAPTLSARMYTRPERLFADQVFELHLEIDAGGFQLGDEMALRNLPGPDRVVTGPFTFHRTAAGEPHHFVSIARTPRAGPLKLAPVLLTQVVEKRRLAFGSTWITTSRSVNVSPLVCNIMPLPDANRPSPFSGAIGCFTNTFEVSPTALRPNDLVTVQRSVSGRGWLAQTRLEGLEPGERFRAYPLRETSRDDQAHITATQVLIPLSTNAHTIVAPPFSYFDPIAERYVTTSPPPVLLTFTDKAATEAFEPFTPAPPHQPAVDPADAASRSVVERLVAISHPTRKVSLTRWIRLGGTVLALCLLIGIFPRSRWAAVLLAVAVGLATTFGARRLDMRAHEGRLTVTTEVRARLAPSRQARALFPLAAGDTVRLHEDAGPWLRVESDRRHGWIPAGSVASQE